MSGLPVRSMRLVAPSWAWAGLLVLVSQGIAGCPKKGGVEGPAATPAASSTAQPGDRGRDRDEPEPEPEEVTPPPVDPTLAMTPAQRVDAAASLLEGADPASLPEALRLLESALAQEPANAWARLNLAVAASRSGDVARARAQLTEVTASQPTWGKAWYYLAGVDELAGDAALALQHVRAGLAAQPDDMDLRVAEIRLLRRAGDLDGAIARAKSALEVNARSIPVYEEMGQAWLARDRLDVALFVYEKARSIPGHETNSELMSSYGWLKWRLGERYAAQEVLKAVVAADPRIVSARVYMSRILLEDRNYGEMIPLLEQAIAVDPKNADLYTDLGVALRGAGRFDEARAAWDKALSLDPADLTPRFNIGVLLGDNLKQYLPAIGELKAYVSAGGKESALAETYIAGFEKEKSRAEQRKKQDEDKARRERERAEREAADKAAREAEKAQPAPSPEPAPETPTPEAPAPENAPEGGGGMP
jgi:tetratricopeptide (TPR) repeat protein